MNRPELSLVIPCYNEEASVKIVATSLASALVKSKVDYELILVDNGSTDGTRSIIRHLMQENSRIRLTIVAKNQGFGWGVISGLRDSKGVYIGYLGADNQVSAENVIDTFKKIRDEKLDLCKGTRIARWDGISRELQSCIYNLLFMILFRVKTKDVNGSPKLMTRDMYQKSKLTSKDWFIDTELMIRASKMGLRIGEVPLVFTKRESGRSSVNPLAIFEFLKNMAQYRLRLWRE